MDGMEIYAARGLVRAVADSFDDLGFESRRAGRAIKDFIAVWGNMPEDLKVALREKVPPEPKGRVQ